MSSSYYNVNRFSLSLSDENWKNWNCIDPCEDGSLPLVSTFKSNCYSILDVYCLIMYPEKRETDKQTYWPTSSHSVRLGIMIWYKVLIY